MKNLVSKITKGLLTAAMALSLAACSESTGSSSGEDSGSGSKHHKIAVLEVQLNDESTNRAKWFNDYVAPEYDCEFMFSEAIQDLDKAMSFIENAADAGCEAVINYYPIGANTQQLVELCRDLGMAYVENGGSSAANEKVYTGDYDNFGGGFMADQPDTGRLFKEYIESSLDTSKEHGFIVGTGNAYQGNAQQTEISSNMLTALQDMYGLKFEKSIEELYQSDAPVEAKNDKGIEIYCYPGAPSTSGWLEGLNAAMQTGKYDYLLMSGNVIGNIMTTVDELESAMNKDFTVIGFGSFGEALTSAMNAKDKFGNQALAMSTVKFTSIVSAMGFAKVYNILTGHPEVNVESDGSKQVSLFRMNAVTSPEQLAEMSNWDTDGKWVADYNFINSLLAEKTPGLTADQFQKNIYAMDYDAIKARLGSN